MHESEPTEHTYRQGRAAVAALLAANLISGIGNWITLLAIPWFVLTTTGSASRAGIAVAVGALPVIIAGIFGGAIVDRLGYKRASIVSDLASGCTVLLIPLFHETIGLAFWQLLTLVFLSALLDIPGMTARQSLLPELVERAGMQLERANAIYSLTRRTAGLIGPPLAGVLIALFGAGNVLWIDAATFAVSAGIFAALVPAIVVQQAEPTSYGVQRYLGEIREGLQFLRRDAVLFWLTMIMAIGSLLTEPLYGIILPVYAREVFDSSVDLGLVFAALAAGSIGGNVLYLLFGTRVPRRVILITGVTIRALSFWVLLSMPSLWVVAGAIFINALFLEPANPLLMTIFQERVPAGMRGRVFGTTAALSGGTQPLGLLIYGFLLQGVGLQSTLLTLAIVSLAMPLAIVLAPAMRDLQRPAQAAAPDATGLPREEAPQAQGTP